MFFILFSTLTLPHSHESGRFQCACYGSLPPIILPPPKVHCNCSIHGARRHPRRKLCYVVCDIKSKNVHRISQFTGVCFFFSLPTPHQKKKKKKKSTSRRREQRNSTHCTASTGILPHSEKLPVGTKMGISSSSVVCVQLFFLLLSLSLLFFTPSPPPCSFIHMLSLCALFLSLSLLVSVPHIWQSFTRTFVTLSL